MKRVIGVEGDVISCCDDQGRIAVNGQALDEDDYTQLTGPGADCRGPMPQGDAHCDWSVGPVPQGRLFVMGDNRNHSSDSSRHACLDAPDGGPCDDSPYVDVDDVVGKVFLLPWPADRFTLLHRPETFAAVPDAP